MLTMRKKYFHIVLFMGLILCVSASVTSAKTITLRLSNGLAPTVYQNKVLLPEFAKDIKERTKGQVTVELYPGKALYDHAGTVEALRRGAVEMGFSAIEHWSGYNQLFSFAGYGFLVPDIKTWQKNESKIRPMMSALWEKIGVKLIAFVPYSHMSIPTKTLVEKPEDFKGIRVRGIADPYFDTVKAWGGVPAAMDPSEAYDALAKGALGGVMTSWESVEKRKFFEIADYVVGPINASLWAILMNLRVWNSLPADVKQSITEAAKITSEKGMDEQNKIDEGSIKFLKTKMKVKILTDEEIAVWKEATKPAYKMFYQKCRDKNGKEAMALLEMFGCKID